MQTQHWNDVLEYVKLNLGVPVNLLEISDDELIGFLKRQVLPLFSQYAPHKKYCYLTAANLATGYAINGNPQYMYTIPVDEGDYIIDILEAYPIKETTIVDTYGSAIINAQLLMDTIIANSYIDAVKSNQVRNTWDFRPPNILIFDQEVTTAVVVYNTSHDVLNTVRPDLYHKAFKPLCLANTKLWIAAMRSKFENLATPLGTLNLNYDKLYNEGDTLRNDIITNILETIPPDILIEVS